MSSTFDAARFSPAIGHADVSPTQARHCR